MVLTEDFRKQQAELLNLTVLISSYLEPDVLARNAKEVRSQLSRLAGKFEMYLAVKEKHFYPKLLADRNDLIRFKARHYQKYMEETIDLFIAYLSKWPHAKAIQKEPDQFVDETRAFFSSLASRINRENSELYRLVEHSLKMAC